MLTVRTFEPNFANFIAEENQVSGEGPAFEVANKIHGRNFQQLALSSSAMLHNDNAD
jgi:hypothetical protein